MPAACASIRHGSIELLPAQKLQMGDQFPDLLFRRHPSPHGGITSAPTRPWRSS